MIKITIHFNQNQWVERILIIGHAPLTESFSIECAAISTLAETLCLGLKEIYKQTMIVKKKGFIEIYIQEKDLKIREEIERYLFSFIIMFKKLSKEFHDTIQLEIKHKGEKYGT